MALAGEKKEEEKGGLRREGERKGGCGTDGEGKEDQRSTGIGSRSPKPPGAGEARSEDRWRRMSQLNQREDLPFGSLQALEGPADTCP